MTETVSFTEGEGLKPLIELATKGLFPIFHPSWIESASQARDTRATYCDLQLFAKIEKSLSKHKSLERKKTVMMALTEAERTAFICHFLQKVECRILETKPIVH